MAEFDYSSVRQISVPGYGLLDADGDGVAETLPSPITPRRNLNAQPWSLPFESRALAGSLRWQQRLSESWRLELRAAGQDIRTAADAIISALSGRVQALKSFGVNTLQLEAELGGKIAKGTAEDQAAVIEAILSVMEAKFKGGTERLEQTWGCQ